MAVAAPTAAPGQFAADLAGVQKLKLGYLMGILGGIISLIAGIVNSAIIGPAIAAAEVNALLGTGGSTSVNISNGLIYAYMGLGAAGPAVMVLAFLFVYLGFSKLKTVESHFSTASLLSLLGVIGAVLLLAGNVLSATYVLTFLNCLNASSAVFTTCYNSYIAAAVTATALTGGGALLLFLGFIGNVLGNLKAKDRYAEPRLKIGAILLLFWIGTILLFIDYGKIEAKLKQGFTPQTMVAAPMMVVAAPQPIYGYGAPPAQAPPPAYGQPPAAAPPYGAPPAQTAYQAPPAYQSPPAYQAPPAQQAYQAPPQQQPAYQQPPAAQPAPAYGAQPSYAAPAAAAPAAAPAPAATGGAPSCTSCGKPTTFVPQYNRYYCYGCAQYA